MIRIVLREVSRVPALSLPVSPHRVPAFSTMVTVETVIAGDRLSKITSRMLQQAFATYVSKCATDTLYDNITMELSIIILASAFVLFAWRS